MIIYAHDLVKDDEPFSFTEHNGKWPTEQEILDWLTEHFGEYGERWTYYYLIDYFTYPDADYPHMVAMAADVAWVFYYEEDAMLFVLSWG